VAGRPFTLRLTATPSAVPEARHELAKIAFGHGADSFAVTTVVSELVGNAVQHAYPGVEPGLVLVTARSTPGWLVIAVADDGGGMQPPWKDKRERFGLGLRLSTKLTDELRIESDENGTTVFASFPLLQTA
jgi:anti-sigma regulatory factor (Ser/Thr protein kinase)